MLLSAKTWRCTMKSFSTSSASGEISEHSTFRPWGLFLSAWFCVTCKDRKSKIDIQHCLFRNIKLRVASQMGDFIAALVLNAFWWYSGITGGSFSAVTIWIKSCCQIQRKQIIVTKHEQNQINSVQWNLFSEVFCGQKSVNWFPRFLRALCVSQNWDNFCHCLVCFASGSGPSLPYSLICKLTVRVTKCVHRQSVFSEITARKIPCVKLHFKILLNHFTNPVNDPHFPERESRRPISLKLNSTEPMHAWFNQATSDPCLFHPGRPTFVLW